MMNQTQLYTMNRKYGIEFLYELKKEEVLHIIYNYFFRNGLGNDEMIIGVFDLVR